jgi:hypothetical protein
MDRPTGPVGADVATVEFEGVESPAPERRGSPIVAVAGVAVVVAAMALTGPWGTPAGREGTRPPSSIAPTVAIPAALHGRTNRLAFVTPAGRWYGARLRRLWSLDIRTGRLVSRGIGAAIRGRGRVFLWLDRGSLISLDRLAGGWRPGASRPEDSGLLWSASGQALVALDLRTGRRVELRLPPGLRAVGPVAAA